MPNISRCLPRRPAVLRALPLLVPFALPLMIACGTQGFEAPPPVEPDALYWDLTLNHHAVTLGAAPYDTLTLAAVPRNAAGKPIPGLPAPEYVSRDLTKIVVTPEGVLRVVGVGVEPVWVVATLWAQGVSHTDSARVRVVDAADPPPVLTTFSVQPTAPDSAKVAMEWVAPLVAHAADEHGQPMSDLMVDFRSSDPDVAKIDPITGIVTGNRPGDVTFYASTTAFGVAKADSVHYRVGLPIMSFMFTRLPKDELDTVPDLTTKTVGVGAVVMWVSFFAPITIEFDDADLPNILAGTTFSASGPMAGYLTSYCAAFSGDCSGTGNSALTKFVARVFSAPGTYDYRCVPCGNKGRIVVVDETEP